MFILKSRFFGRCAGLINEQRYTILSEYFKYVLDFNFLQYMHVFRWADSKNVIIVIIFNELDPLYDCKGFLARRSNLPYLFYEYFRVLRVKMEGFERFSSTLVIFMVEKRQLPHDIWSWKFYAYSGFHLIWKLRIRC